MVLRSAVGHDRQVPTSPPELSSIATALSELTRRVGAIAEDASAAHQDDLASELFAVERSLTAAGRRMDRLAAGARRAR